MVQAFVEKNGFFGDKWRLVEKKSPQINDVAPVSIVMDLAGPIPTGAEGLLA
jgi:hypothetical protein